MSLSKKRVSHSNFFLSAVICLTTLPGTYITLFAQGYSTNQNITASYYPKKIVNRVELLAGGSFIYPKEKYDENRVAKYGYTVGLNLVHDFGSSPFDLNLKLGYEQKGWNSITYSPNTDFNPPITQKLIRSETLNYLTLSLLPTIQIRGVDNLSLGIGGYIGYLKSLNLKYELYWSDTLVSNFRGKPDPYPSLKKFDWGVIAAVNYRVRLNSRSILFRLESNVGMYNYNKPSITDKANRTFSLIIGIPLYVIH